MDRFLSAIIISVLIVLGTQWLIDSSNETAHQNVYYNAGQIVELGQCNGSSKCSYTYKDANGEIRFGTSSKPVSIGQLVYQECWYEIKKGNQCYVEYEPSKNQ